MADGTPIGSIRPGPPERATARSWLVAALLALCYTIAYIDRQVISLLIRPIEASLKISDTQIGLLQGVSFSLFYVAAALPLAWLADHSRRSRVMAGCMTFWTAMTVACGFATVFWQMMLARIGIAIGEAGLTPAALATLADRFNRRQLAVATAMFMLAPFVGGGLALAGGGTLYAWAKGLNRSDIPLPTWILDWQIVFLVIGAAGLLPALLLLLIRDRAAPVVAKAESSLGEVFSLFRRYWKIFLIFQLAMAIVMIVLASYVTWLPAAIMRSKGIDEARIGAVFGPIYLVCGAAGTLTAGAVVTMRAGTDPVRAVLRYMLLMLTLLWPIATAGLLVPSLRSELVLMGAALFLISSVTSLSSLPFQYITPRHLRAQAIALMAMVAALFGTGLGPVIAGVVSDRLSGVRYPLSVALAGIGAVCVPVVMLMILVVLREHRHHRLDLTIMKETVK
jgi:MFS family permease